MKIPTVKRSAALLLFALVLIVSTSIAVLGQADQATKSAQTRAQWQKISIPALPAFKPQQPKRVQLPNGMVIFLQEDHELPLVGGTARIRGGSVNEPAGKTGLVDMYGEVWRTGGTKTQ